jgi:hypothetical protein
MVRFSGMEIFSTSLIFLVFTGCGRSPTGSFEHTNGRKVTTINVSKPELSIEYL